MDIFEISAGWNLIGPNSNQDRDPFTSIPRKITATRSSSVNIYIGSENPSYTLGLSTKRMMPARPNDVRIHTNCFPLRQPQSKIDDGSDDCTEA